MKNTLLIFIISLGLISSTKAHIKLENPYGGEIYQVGQQINIEWAIIVPHNTLNCDLYFSKDSGETWEVIKLDIDPDIVSYHWEIPDVMTDHARIRVVQDNVNANYEDECDDFTINASTGISSEQNIPGLKIYPNPASDYLFIDNNFKGAGQLDIYNPEGKFVKQFKLSGDSFENTSRISLNDLHTGLYLVMLRTKEGMYSRKIIIE